MNQKYYKNNNKKQKKILDLLIREEKLEKVAVRIKKTSLLKRLFNWVYRKIKDILA